MEISAFVTVFGFIFNNVQYILGVILVLVVLIYLEQHLLSKSHLGLSSFIRKYLPFLRPFLAGNPSESHRVSESESQVNHDITPPSIDFNDKSYELLHQAMEKSQEMLSQAELDTIKQTAQTRLNLNKYEQGLETELHNLVDTSKQSFAGETSQLETELKSINAKFEEYLNKLESQSQVNAESVRHHLDQSQETFSQFLTDLSVKSQALQQTNQEESKKRIDELFKGIENKISDYLIQNEQKMMLSIDLELRSARQLIDTYKVQQLSIIDENIVAMLEKTLSLVLSKKLNLRDQMDLIYEALEKAKVEKFIV